MNFIFLESLEQTLRFLRQYHLTLSFSETTIASVDPPAQSNLMWLFFWNFFFFNFSFLSLRPSLWFRN